jgi:hypothetical protein
MLPTKMETTMRYMLMFYADESIGATLPPETIKDAMEALGAWHGALVKAGAAQPGTMRGLQPTSSATKVSTVGGKALILDGPYAETREQLGGFAIIDVPDLDAALACAAKCPASTWGTVEVRPFHHMSP